jgi:hypothetical protein
LTTNQIGEEKMATTEMQDLLLDQMDKLRDVQCLLTAISKFDPGGAESRLADMAEKQLDIIHDALEKCTE